MKKVFLLLLCAASVALVGCKKDNQGSEEPKTPKYSVADEVDFNVMKTLTSQFTIDSTKMTDVIKGLGFTYVINPGEDVYRYYRSAAESKDDNSPVISIIFRSSGYTEKISYSSATSFNVVNNKSQIINQMNDTIVVYGRDCIFERGRVNSGQWMTSKTDLMAQVASANSVDAEWYANGSGYVGISVRYDKENDITHTGLSCDAPDL